ncbi:recombinase family protein [Streptomyces sp. SCA2-4]|nr:recombinase family protein [Streptomyces huiliensis]
MTPLTSTTPAIAANPLTGTVFETTLRGVRCIRLSVWTDETTSPERQREADDQAAAALNIDFGTGATLREAVDLDVSASTTSPFDRPQLGAWLARPDDFDALVFWRFDRAIRSMGHMAKLAEWAQKHQKVLVFAEGVGGGRLIFDFSNPMDLMSRLMMTLFAFAAEVETQSIKERVTGAQAAMRTMALRWRGGGAAPYGYMPIPMPKEHGGSGWTLAQDPEAVKVIKRIIRMLKKGLALHTIALTLNEEGVPAPAEHWARLKHKLKHGDQADEVPMPARRGKHPKFAQWQARSIAKLLRRETLLGWKMHDNKPVRDDKGNPIMITESPILTRKQFDEVGALLTKPAADKPEDKPTAPVRKDSSALLLRVIHCAGCGRRMYYKKGKHTYECASFKSGERCPAPTTVGAGFVDEHVTDAFLRLVGPVQYTRTITVPGYDPQPEIDATTRELEEHQKQQGRQKSKAAQAAWQRHYDGLDTRLAELESREKVEPRTERIPTGRTYADDWHQADTAGRRAMLIEAGVRLDVRRGRRGGWRTVDVKRVDFTITGELAPVVEEAVAVAETVQREHQREHAPVPGARARLATAA